MTKKRDVLHSYETSYDAHAGRIARLRSDHGRMVPIQPQLEAMAPEEYLLRRHRRLLTYPFEDRPDLPSSELVTAIHFYISQQCQKLGRDDIYTAYDGTALLAIAIELEEKIKQNLGPNGHLVYAQPKENQ